MFVYVLPRTGVAGVLSCENAAAITRYWTLFFPRYWSQCVVIAPWPYNPPLWLQVPNQRPYPPYGPKWVGGGPGGNAIAGTLSAPARAQPATTRATALIRRRTCVNMWCESFPCQAPPKQLRRSPLIVGPRTAGGGSLSVQVSPVNLTKGHIRRVKRFVLWDIDGTLVRGGEIGAQVFDLAIEHVLGVRPPERVRMSGKTDPQIVREYLAMLGRAGEDEHIPAILSHLADELEAAKGLIREHGCALPGVEEILRQLSADPEVRQSVLTGNIAPNALVKLSAFSLERWLDLDIGAYGSDHADRNALVPIALERAARLRGVSYVPGEVWVVGDSENDLACARAGGVRCLLVATGRSTIQELETLDPDELRSDLADVDDVVRLLRS